MKNFFYFIAFLFILSCAGKDGAVGPKGDKGDKGDTGATGSTGATGKAGTNGSQAYTYDFTLDVSSALANYSFKNPIQPDEMVFVFLKSKAFYTPLPINDYAYDINNQFHKINMHYEYASFLLFIDNDTTLPAGATFSYRAVVIKGVPGNRLDAERYTNYENLKADFNLPD